MAKKGENYLTRFIFQYSTRHLPKKDKVRFYYALKGRDGKSGIIVSMKIEQLGRTVLLVSEKAEQEVEEFLNFWKCSFKKRKVMIEK